MSQNVVHVAFLVALGVRLASRCPNQLENNDTQEGSKEVFGVWKTSANGSSLFIMDIHNGETC